jgi:hypothetical protein
VSTQLQSINIIIIIITQHYQHGQNVICKMATNEVQFQSIQKYYIHPQLSPTSHSQSQVHIQAEASSQCAIGGRQHGILTGFSPSTLVFPDH